MKIKLKNTPEQIELIKALGSKDKSVSMEASEALAAFLSTVIQQVLQQAGTASMIYVDSEFDEDDSPSYPLDLYYDQNVDYVSVWSQSVAGGLPTNTVEGNKEMKIATYRLDTAVSFLKKYARRSRLDVVSKATERMAQELLVKQELNAWTVILSGLAQASTKGVKHVIRANTAGVFQVQDLNDLMVRIKRINQSFAAGTPVQAYSKGLTDLIVSPEIKGQIRAFAYQPMNTRNGATTTSGATSIALPDNVREEIYRAAGSSEIYGVAITELNELGISQKYNTLFGALTNSVAYTKLGGSGSAGFNTGTEEILVGLDLSRDAFIRPVAKQAESGGQLLVLPDDQFLARSEKTGFYAFLEEGRVMVDGRAVCGLVI